MARLVAATSSANEVRGLPAVVTRKPLAFNNGTIFDQLESSANAPCTSTTFFAAPVEPPCAIATPPNEYNPTVDTTAIVAITVRIGPPAESSSQTCQARLERSGCSCRFGLRDERVLRTQLNCNGWWTRVSSEPVVGPTGPLTQGATTVRHRAVHSNASRSEVIHHQGSHPP